MDADSALFRKHWACQKNPKMTASPAHLQRRFHLVLCKVVLQLQQVFHRILVIGVDGNPFAALRRGVDGVKADRDFAFQVLTDGFIRQHHGYVCPFHAGLEVIVPPAFRVRSQRLNRVRAAVHEEPFGKSSTTSRFAVIVLAINSHLLPAFSGFRAFIRLLPTRYSNVGVGR